MSLGNLHQQNRLLPVGSYYIKIKSPNGCISSSNGVLISQPQLLTGSSYVVTQPTTCTSMGSITITSPVATQYSFDDGVTWSTNPTANNLTPGYHQIKIKDACRLSICVANGIYKSSLS